MSPLFLILMAEAFVFYVANFGDFFLTNILVRKYGFEIEANPRVRRMYETGRFKSSYLTMTMIAAVYAFFWVMMGDFRFPLVIVGLGAILPAVAAINLVWGASVFLWLKIHDMGK